MNVPYLLTTVDIITEAVSILMDLFCAPVAVVDILGIGRLARVKDCSRLHHIKSQFSIKKLTV
jgi:hypothetical protein